jgi:hypothetical protein
MHHLPVRCLNGYWEVQIPLDHHNEWIRCDSQQDAHQLSLSGNLAYEAFERKRSGEEIAQELETAARLCLKYGCTARAAWLHEHAKYARGEPSMFDGAAPGDH